MNSDIRIKIGFHRHPKFKKLRKELGADGVLSVQILWGYVAQNREDGNLAGMSAEDIELAAEWEGEPGKFVRVIHSLRLLDKVGRGYTVHDWAKHNPYAAAAPFRTEKARKAALTRWGVDAPSIPEHCPEHERALPVGSSGNAPSPSPSPSPRSTTLSDADASSVSVNEKGNGSKPRKITYSTEFLRFWEAYPRPVGKDEAFKAWTKARNNGAYSAKDIFNAAHEYERECRKEGKAEKFTLLPATFLNSGRWKDYAFDYENEVTPYEREFPEAEAIGGAN